MRFSNLKLNKIDCLPKTAGVYCFLNTKEVLYIGKAANIKERVKNHFQQPTFKDRTLLNLVKQIGYIRTDSEITALILEAKLIKKYQPKYNVAWRDDKNYFFVGIGDEDKSSSSSFARIPLARLTKEDFPRVFITHQPIDAITSDRTLLRQNYVGPFVDGKALKQTLKVLRKIFPYRSCRVIPNRPCLWYQLSRCPAPCLLKSPLSRQIEGFRKSIIEECQRNVKNLMKVLRGKKTQVWKDLKKEMKKASALRDFEKAAKVRDQILSLERILSHAKIFEELAAPPTSLQNYKETERELKNLLKTKKGLARIEAYDVSNIQGQKATGSMVTFINGLPDKNFYRRFKIKIAGTPNDTAMIKETLSRRFNHPEWGLPDLILIDGGKAQLNAAIEIRNQHKSAKSASVSVLALAKKKNELFIEGKKEPILLKSLPREVFNLIMQLRDEAHRFAIAYHRKLRKKGLFEI